MKYLIIIPLICYLCGCAPTRVCHTYKTDRDFEIDRRLCMNQAAQSANAWGMQGNIFMIADETRKCLFEEKGWYACESQK